jgi:hypothetical protein
LPTISTSDPNIKIKLGAIAASDTIRDMMIEDDIKYESKIWQIKRNVYMIVDDLYRNIYLAPNFICHSKFLPCLQIYLPDQGK